MQGDLPLLHMEKSWAYSSIKTESNQLSGCQGHSHPKLLVALGEGSKSSADNIQPTARR